ncbi:unnamed protein product [Polarella glacialis]|uniref:MYND-type domain-containing protein n=1 Tax=Polarella glacialis TaxID=89957 RepID=A0A813L481_POLGL|nr:unnamed protein product [Polarella glacialis]
MVSHCCRRVSNSFSCLYYTIAPSSGPTSAGVMTKTNEEDCPCAEAGQPPDVGHNFGPAPPEQEFLKVLPETMIFAYTLTGCAVLHCELKVNSRQEAATSTRSMLVPQGSRAFFGMHWTDYDKLWFQACGKCYRKFSLEGLQVMKDFVLSRVIEDVAWDSILSQVRESFDSPLSMFLGIAVKANSKAPVEQPGDFNTFMSWLGAAKRAQKSSAGVAREEQMHAAMGGLVVERPTLDVICERILSLTAWRHPRIGVRFWSPDFIDGSVVIRKSVSMPGEADGEPLGMTSAGFSRGFSCTDKICECCRKALPLGAHGGPKKGSCSGCRMVYYCSVEHQSEHWPLHKEVCSKRNAGTEGDTGPLSLSHLCVIPCEPSFPGAQVKHMQTGPAESSSTGAGRGAGKARHRGTRPQDDPFEMFFERGRSHQNLIYD